MVNGDCLGQDMRSVVPEYAQNEECDFLIMFMFIHLKAINLAIPPFKRET